MCQGQTAQQHWGKDMFCRREVAVGLKSWLVRVHYGSFSPSRLILITKDPRATSVYQVYDFMDVTTSLCISISFVNYGGRKENTCQTYPLGKSNEIIIMYVCNNVCK